MIMAINVEPDSRTSSSSADPEGVRTPLENYKNIGYLSNTGPDPLKITELPIQHSMYGHYRPASETPFKWRFAGGPLMARSLWYLDLSSKKKRQSWTPSHKLSGSADGHYTRKRVFPDLRSGYGEMIGFRRGSLTAKNRVGCTC